MRQQATVGVETSGTSEAVERQVPAVKIRTRPWIATLILFGGLIATSFSIGLSVSFGAADISFTTVWQAIFQFNPDLTEHQIIQELRLPRVLGGAMVGCCFAVAGAIMQGMTRNPLADSGLLGLNAGAGFVLALCFAFFPGVPFLYLIFFSFLGAGLGAGLVYGVGSLAKGGLTPVRLVLAGAAVSVVGAVGFVGLIIPHLTRFLVGVDYRWIIPCSAVLGSLLVILADLAARMVNPPYETPIGEGSKKQELILFEFRLPRIVISVLLGVALAVSGCIMQGISRNALADPGILGINAGAGLCVMLFISFYPTTAAAPVFLLPVLALVGAGATATFIYTLSYRRHQGILPTRLILTGIAVAAGISAAMIVLTLRLSPDKYQFVATWMAGSIWGTNWQFVLALLPWIVVLLPFVFYKARVMNMLNLGEQMAVGLGTPVERERLLLLAAAVGLAGSSVAVSGGIGFVGLIGPHLARRLGGPKHQVLLPTSALAGALLVIIADTLGRWMLQPSEIPTGIVVAIIGAPYFLYLLARTKA